MTKKIDWEINVNDLQIFLDVKNRTGYTANHLESVAREYKGTPTTEVIPEINAESFFKSTNNKFIRSTRIKTLNGIWFQVGIKVNADILNDYFESTECSNLDFYIIGSWNKEVYIRARNDWQRLKLLDIFELVESSNFVFFNSDV